jgi:hypothetical protein
VVQLGILSLGDLQRDRSTGRLDRPVDRMAQILGYAAPADQLSLEVFAVGEHHSAEFFTPSPAVVLAGPGRGIDRPIRHRDRARPALRMTRQTGLDKPDYDTKEKRYA